MKSCRPYTLSEEAVPAPDEWRAWAMQCAPLRELVRRVRESMQEEVAHVDGAGDRLRGGATDPASVAVVAAG